MIIIHIHTATDGAVRSTVEIKICETGEVEVEQLTPADIAEQEPDSPGDESEIGFEISGWPEESPRPSPDIWKDKQGLK